MCPGVGLEGWLGCFAHPLGAVVCRGHAQYPAFASSTGFFVLFCFATDSSEVAVGVFGPFVSFGFRICPNC